jgi:hypothetical protein
LEAHLCTQMWQSDNVAPPEKRTTRRSGLWGDGNECERRKQRPPGSCTAIAYAAAAAQCSTDYYIVATVAHDAVGMRSGSASGSAGAAVGWMGTAGLITAAVCCCFGDDERRPKLFVTCCEKKYRMFWLFFSS